MRLKNERILIRCIFDAISESAEKLLTKLQLTLAEQWPDVMVTTLTQNDYWKKKDYKEIIFIITSAQNISVKEIMKVFKNLTWYYYEGEVFNLDSNIDETVENAMWNKLTYPKEQFLSSAVSWVHLYNDVSFEHQ